MHSDTEMVRLRDVVETLIYMTDEDSDGVEEVMQLPTIDLVRCRDCRWAEPNEFDDYDCRCHIPIFRVNADGYCSYGKSKENE